MRAGLWLVPLLLMGCARGGDGLGQATLGADFRDAETLREDGVVLQEVLEKGPAGRAGLRPDDLVLSIDGRPVDSKCALEREVFARFPREKVKLTVRRGVETFETELKLVEDRKLYERSCNGGDASGCYFLGRFIAGKSEAERDELFARACEGGSPGGCAEQVGRALDKNSDSAADPRMQERARKACDQGNAAGCGHVAVIDGAGDAGRALRLFDKACDLGDPSSCFNAASHHERREDPERALVAYERACDLGSPAGCVNAGFLHERGMGVQADAMRAVRAYRRACEGTPCEPGEALGCTNLGILYQGGTGVARNLEAASQLYGRGCAGGNAQGCTYLADLVAAGDAVPADIPEARQSLRIACSNGHEGACAWLEQNP